MKNKVIAAFLAVVMTCGMLAGCGAKEEPAAEVPAATEEEAEAEAPAEEVAEELEHVELTWYYRSDSYPDQDAVFAKANEIIESEINATVNFVPIAPSDYEQKMQTKYASGDAGDINWTSSWNNKYGPNVGKGAFYDITDLLDQYAPKLKAFFTEDQWNAVKVEGKIYGVPNAQIFTKSSCLSVRKDLAEKHGLDITTVNSQEELDSFLEACAAEGLILERYGKSGWAQSLYGYGFDDISAYAYVKYDDESLTVVNPYATEEFAAYAALQKKWADKGIIANDAMVKQDMKAEKMAGEIAASVGGTYKPGVEKTTSWAPYEIVCTALGENVLTTSGITATLNAIPATSENPERAMMFLELVNSNKDLFNLLAFGIEGQHYEFVDDAKTTIKRTATDRYQGTDWIMGNTFNGYVQEGTSATIHEETVAQNNSAKASVALGFAFSSEAVNTQIAQVQSVVDEYLPAINCGAVDNVETALAEFNEKLETAGINDIVAEAQAQINAWAETK